MSCNNPFFAVPLVDCQTGAHVTSLETGKQQYRILSAAQAHDEGKFKKFLDDPTVKRVPCGHCMGCRLAYSRVWANRLMLEKQYYRDSQCWFVTLTYNDWHVPLTNQEVMTLKKSDVQNWLKRLRKASGSSIRYYLSGEYGTSTVRPHYHVILFGLTLDDLELQYCDSKGNPFYRSRFLESAWSSKSYDELKLNWAKLTCSYDPESYKTAADFDRIGNVLISPVSWDTCAYTARYVVKKLTGKGAFFYDSFGIAPPFSTCSLKPGIGRKYYDDHKEEIFRHEYFHISTPDGARRVYPPRYYKSCFDSDAHDRYLELVAAHSEYSLDSAKVRRVLSGLDYWTQQEVAERRLSDKVNSLERSLE